MPKKIQVELIPAKAFEIKKGHKYLIIMPAYSELKELAPALKKFFNNEVLVIAAQDANSVRIAELMEEA